MLNKTICCLSDLIYFICSTRHLNTYKKCSGRKIFWTKYFKFTAAFSDSHHHQLQNLFSSCFCLWKEGGETHETSRVWNAWYQSQSGLSDVKLYTLYLLYTSHKCPCFFLLHIFYNWDWRSKSNWIKLTAAGFIRGKDWTKSNYLIYVHFIFFGGKVLVLLSSLFCKVKAKIFWQNYEFYFLKWLCRLVSNIVQCFSLYSLVKILCKW